MKKITIRKPPDSVDVNAGVVLFACRCWRRLSQKELGAAVGVSYQQIQKYETAQSHMSISTLFRLAQVLQVPITMFFVALDGSVPDEEHLRLSPDEIKILTCWRGLKSPDTRRYMLRLLETTNESP